MMFARARRGVGSTGAVTKHVCFVYERKLLDFVKEGDKRMYGKLKRISALTFVLLLALALGVAAQTVPNGTWVDEVVLIEEPSAEKAFSRLVSGDIDLYADSVSNAAVFEDVKAHPALDYYTAFGSYAELTFNVAQFEDGRLNPFTSRKVREAMNWLIDRDYIAQELYGGLATPKLTVLNPAFADYTRVVEKARELEAKYAYDLDKAREVISGEMERMGAQLVGGKWHYNGAPVEIKLLIRTEDARLETGDYVASQLEAIGFTTIRDYKAGAEASPIWLNGDPKLGEWHIVTGGWASPVVYRDQTHNFDQMYTRRVMANPPWQVLEPIPELDDLSDRLRRKDFSTMEERNAMLERTLELALLDSPRIFTVDVQSFVPRRAEISVASDLGGQVAGTLLWASTLRRGEEIGGSVRIAVPQLLIDPWNPVAGSNQLYDQMPIRATMERSIITDPYTGNYWANRIEKAEVYVKEGLPVEKTLDWVDLNFVEEIVVPGDALYDWDAKEQRFITIAEAFPEGVTANRRSVTYFPADFYDTVKWHDGSPVSFGDIMFWIVLGYDRGKIESPLYDETRAAELEAALRSSRGFRILSQDPLIIESYSDTWALDAEFLYGEYFPVDINLGSGAWHNIGLGIRAETAKEAAFSSAKAAELEVNQIGMHTGPTLSILAKHLGEAKAEGYIPFEKFLSQYISADEVAQRYANLEAWYKDKNHFWLGTGPMYLDRVYPVEKMIVLKRNPHHPDPADKWTMFDAPRIPEIEIVRTGALRVQQGTEVSFDVHITYEGEPYLAENLSEVNYVIGDSRGNIVLRGEATFVEDGKYKVTLTEEQTKQLPVGSNKLDIIVLSKLVGGAQFESVNFVTTR